MPGGLNNCWQKSYQQTTKWRGEDFLHHLPTRTLSIGSSVDNIAGSTRRQSVCYASLASIQYPERHRGCHFSYTCLYPVSGETSAMPSLLHLPLFRIRRDIGDVISPTLVSSQNPERHQRCHLSYTCLYPESGETSAMPSLLRPIMIELQHA